MMGDEVFVDLRRWREGVSSRKKVTRLVSLELDSTHLNHRGNRLHLVLKLRLSTDSDDALVVDGAGDHSVERVGIDGLEKEERTGVSFDLLAPR